MKKIAISACLAGIACRYNGQAKPNENMIKMAREEEALLFCPEVLGGLSTPRVAAEIVGGDGFDVLNGKAKVISRDGNDVTKEFILGAEQTLKLFKENGVTHVYLKARSPSCGVKQIYDGTFTGTYVDGVGVSAALLASNGLSLEEV